MLRRMARVVTAAAAVAAAALVLLGSNLALGFVQPSFMPTHARRQRKHYMFNNIFDSLDDFFKNKVNEYRVEDKALPKSPMSNMVNADLPAGTTRLVQLPVSAMKPGGLRLFLMFYMLGMQNTPDKNSWKAHQPSTDAYVVDFWFHDQSAVLSVELLVPDDDSDSSSGTTNDDPTLPKQNMITIDRVGSSPSNQYLMQEAVIVNGVLNELQQCATDDGVSIEHRLLVLQEPDAIERARESLSFG